MKSEALKERENKLGREAKNNNEGYWLLCGSTSGGCPVAYIALPEGHPDIGRDYNELDVNVNGGLTFSEDNVFGWDYCHAYNSDSVEEDMANAYKFFKNREKKLLD